MNREYILRTRITTETKDALQKLADADRRTLSDFARIILENYIAEKVQKMPVDTEKNQN